MKPPISLIVAILAATHAAAGCAAPNTHATPALTPPPSAVVLDDNAEEACKAALGDAYALANIAARQSTVTQLQDLAVREQQLQNTTLIKAWCQRHYRPS